jgi:plastocyanin
MRLPSRFFRPKALRAAGIAAQLIVMVLGGMLLHSSAQAATQNVSVGTPTNRFTPNSSTVNVGDTVTFTWSAGTHMVHVQDVSPELPIDSAHTSGTTTAFMTAGTFYYYCSIHASADLATAAHVQANDAMVGKIVVVASGAPKAAPSAPSAGSGSTSYSGGSSAGPWLRGVLAAGGVMLIAGASLVLWKRRRPGA